MRPRDLLIGVAAAVAALAVMSLLALAGVRLLGLDAGTMWAAVALAVGGSASLSMRVPGGMIQPEFELHLLPLGLTVAGALVLFLVLRGERRAVLVAASAFLVLLTVVSQFAGPDLHIHLLPTLLGAAVWLAVIFALSLRPVRAVALVLLGTTILVVLAGAVAALTSGNAKVFGTVLLGAPNLVLIAFTRGLGVPWSVQSPLAGVLPAWPADVGGLQPLEANLWPLSIFAVVLVVLCVVLVGRGSSAWWLGAVFAVLVPLAAALAGASVRVWLGRGCPAGNCGGLKTIGIEFGVGGDVALAVPIGLGAGLGVCLFVLGARTWDRRRVEREG